MLCLGVFKVLLSGVARQMGVLFLRITGIFFASSISPDETVFCLALTPDIDHVMEIFPPVHRV